MKPGLTSYACGWAIGVPGWPAPPHPLNIRSFLLLAARHGAEVVQVADNLPVLTTTADDWRAARDFAREQGLTLELGARGLTAAELDAHLDLVASLGDVRLLRFVIDRADYRPELAHVETLLRARRSRLAELDLILALENHDRFRARQLAALIEAIADPRVGICLDTANSLGAGEDIATVLRHLAPLTINLHLKDVRVRRASHQMGFVVEGCALGEGVIDMAGVIDEVRRHGRCASALLEFWPAPDANGQPALEREANWLAHGMRTLHGLLAAPPSS